MRNTLYGFLLCLSVVFSGCGQRKYYTLSGNMPGVMQDSIYVIGMDSRYDRVDTIRVQKGKFTYRTQLDTITPLLLFFSDGLQHVVFADKGQKSELTLGRHDSLPSIIGTEYDAQFAEFLKYPDSLDIYQKIERFIRQDPFSEVTPYLMYKYILPEKNVDFKKVRTLISLMAGVMRENPFVTDLTDKITYNSTDRNFIPFAVKVWQSDSLEKRALGELEFIGDKNNYIYVLWSSWNSYSLPALEYAAKKASDYNVVTFSLDVDRQKWESAIRAANLDSCVNVCPSTGLNSSILDQFGIVSLPYYIVTSKNGKVLFCDMETEKVDSFLTTLSVE